MKNKQQISATLLSLGMLLLLAMAVMPLVGMNYAWVKYVFALGAVLTLVARIIGRYKGKNITIQRLYRIQTGAAICFCASAAMLFVCMRNYVQEKDWLAFLIAGAVVQLYSTFRIEHEEAKEAAAKKDKK